MALKTIIGLYVNEKAGRKYMAGKARERIVIEEGQRVMIFKNDKRTSDKQPEYNIVVAEDDQC